MADEENNEEAAGEGGKKGGLPIKTIIVVAVAMVLEAAVLAGVFMFGGGPEPVEASQLEEDALAGMMDEKEVAIVADKFQNNRRGIAYTYDAEVFVTVQSRYYDKVNKSVEDLQNTFRDDIAKIFRQAEPSHLNEVELLTIKRQVKDAVNDRLGTDEEGDYYVVNVLIPKCQQYRSDL